VRDRFLLPVRDVSKFQRTNLCNLILETFPASRMSTTIGVWTSRSRYRLRRRLHDNHPSLETGSPRDMEYAGFERTIVQIENEKELSVCHLDKTAAPSLKFPPETSRVTNPISAGWSGPQRKVPPTFPPV
jgi:hypothetical protein